MNKFNISIFIFIGIVISTMLIKITMNVVVITILCVFTCFLLGFIYILNLKINNSLRLQREKISHDLMNHVQVLKGYLDLDNIGAAKSYVESLIINAAQERLISNIRPVRLSNYLLRLMDCTNFEIEVDLSGGISDYQSRKLISKLKFIHKLVLSDSTNYKCTKSHIYIFIDREDDTIFNLKVEGLDNLQQRKFTAWLGRAIKEECQVLQAEEFIKVNIKFKK